MMRPGSSEVRSAPALQSGPSSARGPAPFPGLRGCALAAHTPPPATLRASARPEVVCLFLFLWTRVLFPPVETVPFTRPVSDRIWPILVQFPRQYRAPRWFSGGEASEGSKYLGPRGRRGL